jgi:DNA-binding NarL/FixJ family response regulator
MANHSPPLVCIAVSVPLLKKGLIAFFREELSSVEYHILGEDFSLGEEWQERQPDVLVVDAAQLAEWTSSNSSPTFPAATKIILIAPHSNLPLVVRAIQRMTIHAWLPLESELDKLAQALQRLLEGGADFTSLPEMLETFLRERPLTLALSNRERQVLSLIALGHDNAQISELLALQPGTVKNYITTIYQKIGARSRTEAAAFMWKNPDLFLFPGAEVMDKLPVDPPPQG